MDLTVILLLLLLVTYFIRDPTYDHRSKILFIIVFQKAFNIFKIAHPPETSNYATFY